MQRIQCNVSVFQSFAIDTATTESDLTFILWDNYVDSLAQHCSNSSANPILH